MVEEIKEIGRGEEDYEGEVLRLNVKDWLKGKRN